MSDSFDQVSIRTTPTKSPVMRTMTASLLCGGYASSGLTGCGSPLLAQISAESARKHPSTSSGQGGTGALIAFFHHLRSSVDSASQPLLDALDHFCIQADGDPEFARDFYAASTPEEMVALAVDAGILIDADDFRALLRSGSAEHWEVRVEDSDNPIVHLQRVFRV